MQDDRRRNPYPWTWEPVTAVTVGYLLAAWIVLHLSRAAANVFAGSGWDLSFTSTFRVLGGDAGAGLHQRFAPGDIASPTWLYVWLSVGQLWLLGLCIYVFVVWLRRWGPGRMRGTASATEAERLLGLTRIRRDAAVIRPDLYGKEQR